MLPAHKVADDVGVADQDLIAVLLLRGRGAVEVAAERRLNPRAFLEEILEERES